MREVGVEKIYSEGPPWFQKGTNLLPISWQRGYEYALFIPGAFPVLFTALGWYLDKEKVPLYTIGKVLVCWQGFNYLNKIRHGKRVSSYTRSQDEEVGASTAGADFIAELVNQLACCPMIVVSMSPLVMDAFKPSILAMSAKCGCSPELNGLVMLAFKALTIAAATKAAINVNNDNETPKATFSYQGTLKAILPLACGLLVKFCMQERFGNSVGTTVAAVCLSRFTTSILTDSDYGKKNELVIPSLKMNINSFIQGLISNLAGEAAITAISIKVPLSEITHTALVGAVSAVAYYTKMPKAIAGHISYNMQD